MKQLAYHRIRTQNGSLLEGPFVICLDDEQNLLSYHALNEEEPLTEWVGGTYEMNQPNIK